MSRFLSHLLLLLYAGVYLHCQPLPARAVAMETDVATSQGQSRTSLCKKKRQTVQADPQAAKQLVSQGKLLPLDLALGSDFTALYFGLLFPAYEPTIHPARGPDLARAQAFANHPNKAPPVRFS